MQSFPSMRRIEARRKNASAFRLRFSQSLASLRQRLSQAMRVTSISKPGRLAASLIEISAVLDAVRRRDPDLAARNMMIYVRNARDAALEQLSSQ
jgi:DNA-binding FadR family transcriptional regulator